MNTRRWYFIALIPIAHICQKTQPLRWRCKKFRLWDRGCRYNLLMEKWFDDFMKPLVVVSSCLKIPWHLFEATLLMWFHTWRCFFGAAVVFCGSRACEGPIRWGGVDECVSHQKYWANKARSRCRVLTSDLIADSCNYQVLVADRWQVTREFIHSFGGALMRDVFASCPVLGQDGWARGIWAKRWSATKDVHLKLQELQLFVAWTAKLVHL